MKKLISLILVAASLLFVGSAAAADNSNRCADLDQITLKLQGDIDDLTRISADYGQMIGHFNQQISEGRQMRQHLAQDFKTYSQRLKPLGYQANRSAGKLKIRVIYRPAKRGPKVEEAIAMVRASHRALLEIDRAISPLVKDRALLLKNNRQIRALITGLNYDLERIAIIKSDLGCPLA